ncbi:unnamed protein product, partial [Porites lobata]
GSLNHKLTCLNDNMKLQCTLRDIKFKAVSNFVLNYARKVSSKDTSNFSPESRPPFDKTTRSNDKTKVSCTENRLERYLELITRIMG